MAAELTIEVVAGDAGRQTLRRLVVPEGTTVSDAIKRAGLDAVLPDLEIDPARLGIFGQRVEPDQPLKDGDRVEIYRPLKADPKEVRRQLAALNRKR